MYDTLKVKGYLGHPQFVGHEMDLVGDPQKYQHMVVSSVDFVKGYKLEVSVAGPGS